MANCRGDQALPLADVDPDGLLEYSVVYTDRSLNHMSAKFQGVMRSLSATLKEVYNAAEVVLVPGGGSYAMEATARQFAQPGDKVMVLRNGFFSYRWTQIFDQSQFTGVDVVTAQPIEDGNKRHFAPAPIDDVVARIRELRPRVVFAPHVETSAGMILPDEYLTAVGEATRQVDGIFVLDCIASGTIWVDMKERNVDVLLSAPQKGWSGPPSTGLVMLGARGAERLQATTSSSFALDLRTWRKVMEAYEKGGHMYHATMPTDALATFERVTQDMRSIGFAKLKAAQYELGSRVREMLAARGYKSLAAPGFGAPGVVVLYTDDAAIGGKFARAGLQIAAGVPLMVGNGTDSQSDSFRTFRLGLFGLDKLTEVDRAVRLLEQAFDKVEATGAGL